MQKFIPFTLFLFIAVIGAGQTVSDIDGNTYPIVEINGKEWMGENLKTTRYIDGTEIQSFTEAETWENFTDGAYAVFDVPGFDTHYGKLYNWYCVQTHKLCPAGWEVPSAAIWSELIEAESLIAPHGNLNSLGKQLKSKRQVNHPHTPTDAHPRWDEHDKRSGIDQFGFAALPAGNLNSSGSFANMGSYAYFWTSGIVSESQATAMVMLHSHKGLSTTVYPKAAGFSVRCIKSDGTTPPPPTPYTLTVSIYGNGTTSPATGTHEYNEGTEVNLTATADAGWEFGKWVIGEEEIFEPGYTLALNSHLVAAAHFIEEENGGNGIPSIDFNGTTLFVAPTEPESALEWGGDGTTTLAQSDTDGQSNTQTILSVLEDNQGVAYASQYCQNLDYKGFTDWYLPAKDELNAIYEARQELGDFPYNFYWSSTEYNRRFAWYHSFELGFQDFEARKFNTMGVRCVRKD